MNTIRAGGPDLTKFVFPEETGRPEFSGPCRTMPPIPAELQSREQFTVAYDNRAAVADASGVMAQMQARGQAFHAAHECTADVAYGAGPRQLYDWYPAAAGAAASAPVLVFLHGGYWQSRDKADFRSVAAGAHDAGMHVVLGEYTLAPQARVYDMVAEVGLLLDALAAHPVLGVGASAQARLVLCGHSAGGHLAAMHRAHPAVAGVLAISGLFDLEPIRRGALNDALGLDVDEVRACSPQLRIGRGAPTVVAIGGAELAELQRQSHEYAAALRAAGEPASLLDVPGADHFTILSELENRDGLLLARAIALAQATLA